MEAFFACRNRHHRLGPRAYSVSSAAPLAHGFDPNSLLIVLLLSAPVGCLRMYLMDKYRVMPDPWDNRIIVSTVCCTGLRVVIVGVGVGDVGWVGLVHVSRVLWWPVLVLLFLLLLLLWCWCWFWCIIVSSVAAAALAAFGFPAVVTSVFFSFNPCFFPTYLLVG